MLQYKKYLVKEADRFDPEQFSFVMDEMAIIREQTEHVPSFSKAEIIVSFLKDHSLENKWINVNPELTALITSGSVSARNTELLFESCRNNSSFRQQMEDFLKKRLSE